MSNQDIDIRTHDVATRNATITMAGMWGLFKLMIWRGMVAADEGTAVIERAAVVTGKRSQVWANFSIEEHGRTTDQKLEALKKKLSQDPSVVDEQ